MKKAIKFNNKMYNDEVELAKAIKIEYQEVLAKFEEVSKVMTEDILPNLTDTEVNKFDNLRSRLAKVVGYIRSVTDLQMKQHQNNSFNFINKFEKSHDLRYVLKRLAKIQKIEINKDEVFLPLSNSPQKIKDAYFSLFKTTEESLFVHIYECRKVIETLDNIIENVEESAFER